MPCASGETHTTSRKCLDHVIENSFQLAIAMKLTEKKMKAALRRRGYKLTSQRRAVLNVMALHSDHLAPAEIYDEVRKEHSKVGLVTVYRTLDILAELGLLCEVHTSGRERSFVMRRPVEHHHHLICSSCGMVVDFASCDFEALERRLSEETGFTIDSHLLEFTGLCRSCK